MTSLKNAILLPKRSIFKCKGKHRPQAIVFSIKIFFPWREMIIEILFDYYYRFQK